MCLHGKEGTHCVLVLVCEPLAVPGQLNGTEQVKLHLVLLKAVRLSEKD